MRLEYVLIGMGLFAAFVIGARLISMGLFS